MRNQHSSVPRFGIVNLSIPLEDALLETLVAFYRLAPVQCADLCDKRLDRPGRLLGIVRALSQQQAAEPHDGEDAQTRKGSVSSA